MPVPSSASPSRIAPENSDTAPTPNAALERLADGFDQHYASVFRYLLHRFFDKELAEELTAETFYKAASAVHRFRGHAGQLQFWLLRTATNLANTHCRRTRWRRRLTGLVAMTRSTETESDPAGDVANASGLNQVRSALLALPPRYQTVVVLRFYSQMSFDEIAEVVGCRPPAVRTRLSRAIKELRKRLNVSDSSSPLDP